MIGKILGKNVRILGKPLAAAEGMMEAVVLDLGALWSDKSDKWSGAVQINKTDATAMCTVGKLVPRSFSALRPFPLAINKFHSHAILPT